jgi:phosphatidylserine decarboxylase
LSHLVHAGFESARLIGLKKKGNSMVRDAYIFFVPLFALGVICNLLRLAPLALLFFLLAAFVCYFFRNPNRHIPDGKNLIVSPADGKVVRILQGASGEQIISIFLSIFNVHVTRTPIEGEMTSLEYKRGKFKAAYYDEASRLNEQNVITIRNNGKEVVVRQIAGLIARRVICWKKPGEKLKRGELIGLIRFGSRVDVIMPQNTSIKVKIGDNVKGGSTILGDYV